MIDPQEKVTVDLTVGQLLRLFFRSGDTAAPFRPEELLGFVKGEHWYPHEVPDTLIEDMADAFSTYGVLSRAVMDLQQGGAFEPDGRRDGQRRGPYLSGYVGRRGSISIEGRRQAWSDRRIPQVS